MAEEDKRLAVVEDAIVGTPQPWERQEGESDKAFEAFCVYRDSTPSDRSLTKTSQKMSKSRPTLCDWSRKYGWVSRVRAWDDKCDAELREAELKKRREMGERHAKQSASFQRILMEPALALAETLKADGAIKDFRKKLQKMTPEEQLALVRKCATAYPALMRAERLASGESTENIEGRVAVHQVKAVSSRIAALAAKYIPQETLESFLNDLKAAMSNELGE